MTLPIPVDPIKYYNSWEGKVATKLTRKQKNAIRERMAALHKDFAITTLRQQKKEEAKALQKGEDPAIGKARGTVKAGLKFLDTKECGGCGFSFTTVQKCSRCAIALYCSRKCQVEAWPVHKKVCKESPMKEL